MSVEDRVHHIFYGKYTRTELFPPGNLAHVENLIHEDIVNLVRELQEKHAELQAKHDILEEENGVLRAENEELREGI